MDKGVGWVPFLDGSIGSQIFQVKLDHKHCYPSWRHLSVPDTVSLPTHLSHSADNKHTYTHSSVQTFLCSSQWGNMSEYQLFQWLHQSLNTLQIKWHRYTYTNIFIIFPTVFYRVLLLRSNSNKNTFFCTVLYSSQGLQYRP